MDGQVKESLVVGKLSRCNYDVPPTHRAVAGLNYGIEAIGLGNR